MSPETIYIPITLLIVAILYSSVGHGGASGYLAVMSFFVMDVSLMKSSALTLNILVSALAFFAYYKSGHFKFKLFYPFAITSVPFAFIGANYNLSYPVYKQVLGICLIFAIIKILGVFEKKNNPDQTSKNPGLFIPLIIGALIGLVSGMIGIGGGIILSPIILLLHWGNMKESAAVSALFIFVNSIAGIIGVINKGVSFHPDIVIWVGAAFVGGLIGSTWGSKIAKGKELRYTLSLVLLIAAVKMIIFQ